MTYVEPLIVKLTGLTQKGKNRIREVGTDRWIVQVVRHTVQFDSRNGPWWFIAPMGVPNETRHTRWVHSEHDRDFSIEIVDQSGA